MSNCILEMIERVSTSSDKILRRIENFSHNHSLNNFKLFIIHLMKMYVTGLGIVKKLKGKANTKPQMTTIKMKNVQILGKQNNGNVLTVHTFKNY